MKSLRYFILVACIISILPFFAHATFDQNLKYGAKGPAVIELQNFLIAQKYLVSEATGNFYRQTQLAVIAFQKAYGISPLSGYFGPLTRAKAQAVVGQPATLALSTGQFSAPTGVVATAKACTEIWLTWTLPSGTPTISSLEIYRNNTKITSIDSTYGTFVDRDIGGTTNYQYYVVAVASNGSRSNSSATASAQLQNCPAVNTTTPSSPTSLSVQYLSDSALKLTWADNSSNEIGFEMERSVNGGSYSSAGKLQPNLTTVTDTGVAPGILFSYRIRALGTGSGASNYSNEVSYKIAGNQPPTTGVVKLGVFDSVFTKPPFTTYGSPIYWNGVSPWSNGDNVPPTMTKEKVQKVALIGKNGGQAIHNYNPIPPNTFTMIDVENAALERMSTADMVQRFQWMREVAPNLRIGLYWWQGPYTTHWNYDDMVNKTARYYARMKETEDIYRPLIPYLDSYTTTFYLIGPSSVDRDLAAFKQFATDWKKAFPNTPIVPFVLGVYVYHTDTRPPGVDMGDDVLRKYVKVMREYFDGVIIWGQPYDNADLIRIMKEEGALIKPAGYQKTWTANFAP